MIRPGQVYEVGRGREATLQLAHPSVSRRHALIELRAEGLFVTDLGSANGTYLEGRRLPPGEPAQVRSGESIQFADAVVVPHLEGDDSEVQRLIGLSHNVDGSMVGETFELVAMVGQGSFSRVWAAWDKPRKRMVAIKVLTSRDPEASLRFQREARVWGALTSPHVVRLHSKSLDPHAPFLVMELVQGPTLADRIRSGRLELAEALRIAEELTSALVEIHANQTVHRDLKPANVLLGPGGHAKLTDFGIARDLNAKVALTQPGEGLGSLPYASPEQIEGHGQIGPEADQYGLGATLYHALCGSAPFDRRYATSPLEFIEEILNNPPIPLTDRLPELPLDVAEFVHRLLRKDPARRYEDARDLLAELKRLRARYDPNQNKQTPLPLADTREWLPKIIVVDNDGESRERARTLLSADYRVVVTSQVSDLLQEEGYDLALVDVSLPGVSGPDMVRLLRTVQPEPQPLILYYSSLDPEALRQLTAQTNADGYIIKGLPQGELLAALRDQLQHTP